MGVINIEYNSLKGLNIRSQFEKDLDINNEERYIAEHFLNLIHDHMSAADIVLERRSDNYLSLCAGRYDFLRFKYSDRARWLSIDSDYAHIAVDDPRFSAQKNKRTRHWKANIKDVTEISMFDELVLASYLNYISGGIE